MSDNPEETEPASPLVAADEPADVPAGEPQCSATTAEPAAPPAAPDPPPAPAAGWETRWAEMEGALREIRSKLDLLPAQIRYLSAKLEGVATALGDEKYRGLLKHLLWLHGLAEEMTRVPRPADRPAGATSDPLAVLAIQMWQVLEEAGVSRIRESGPFDPAVHCAVGTVTTLEPEQAGCIKELVRPGFTLGSRVLRPAQVVTWREAAPEPVLEPAVPDPEPDSEPDPGLTQPAGVAANPVPVPAPAPAHPEDSSERAGETAIEEDDANKAKLKTDGRDGHSNDAETGLGCAGHG